MNNIMLLTKVFLKNSMLKNFNATTNKKDNKFRKTIAMAIIIIYVASIFGMLSYQMIDMLNQANQAGLFLGVFLLAIGFLILVQSVASSMNLYYFSKDIENVLPLPVKPYQILVAKFNVLIVTEYITLLLFAVVPFGVYGFLTGAGGLFYLCGALVLLLFPILPAIIASLLVVFVMSFSKFVKNKEKMQFIGTLLTIVVVLVMQVLLAGQEDVDTEQLVSMLTKANGTVSLIDNYFVTLEPATQALINYNNIDGAIALAKILAITAVSYVCFVLIAKEIYLRGVVGVSSSGTKTTQKSKVKDFKKKSVLSSYVKKEFIMLFKNPVYFMQCVLPAVIMPILLPLVFFMGSADLSELQGEDINNSGGLCIIIGIICFMLSLVFIPVTSISRDGGNAVFTKYIPVSLYKQFQYKIIPSIIISFVPIIIVLGIAYAVFNANIAMIAISFAISTVLNILYSYTMLVVDLKRPKLNWDTEYAVVKQNFNMMFGFAFIMVYIMILIGLGIGLSHLSIPIVAAILFAITVGALIAVDRYVYNNQDKLFEKVM